VENAADPLDPRVLAPLALLDRVAAVLTCVPYAGELVREGCSSRRGTPFWAATMRVVEGPAAGAYAELRLWPQGRNRLWLLGRLANTVVLRTDLGGDPTARELLRRVRATTLAAFDHQNFPFEQLAEVLSRERGVDSAALAPVMLLLQNAGLRPTTDSAHMLKFEEANPDLPLSLVTITTFDVIVVLRETSDGLVGTCVYKPALFGARTIDRLLRDFRKVLGQMVAQPERPISVISLSARNDTPRNRRGHVRASPHP